MPPPCSRCASPAGFSFYVLLSTVGVRPRAQRSSNSIRLCRSCLEQLIASLAAAQPQLHRQVASSFAAIVSSPALAVPPTEADTDTSKEAP